MSIRTSIRNALLIATALAPLHAALAEADSQVTLYGRLNVALEAVGSSGAPVNRDVKRESNNRSVLGFRGIENLGDGYQALFQIEGALSVDTGAATSFANRDTRVGLSTPWGLVFLGHWSTPYLLATSGFDPFYPTTAGYMSLMANGSAATANNISDRSSFDRRQQNSVHYWTPSWQGFSGRAAYAFNEGEVGPRGSSPRLWSASLNYDEGPWNLALAREEHRDYQGPGLNDSGTKLGVAYRFGDWRLAGAVEQLNYETLAGHLKRDSFYLSATWQLGSGSVRMAYTRAGQGKGPAGAKVGFIAAGSGTGSSQWTVGYDYSLSKRTGLYAYASRIDNQARAAYDFAINGLGAGAGERPHIVATGIRHNF